MTSASAMNLSDLEKDPRLFLYTSLTAGSSHIITATSRMETILKANKIPFQAIDTATDEKARRLWQRRAGQRKLPGLVKEGFVIGDLNEVEEWNEFGELKDNIGPVPANNAAPPGGQTGVNIAPPLKVNPTATQGTSKVTAAAPVKKAPQPVFDKTKAVALPGAEEMAARNKEKSAAATADAKTPTPSSLEAINPETLTSSPDEKKQSIEKAKDVAEEEKKKDDPVAATTESATESTTADSKDGETAPESSDSVSAKEKHRGSDIIEAPKEEIKKVESETSLQEEDEESATAVSKGVADLTVGEDQKTQEQSAKEPEAASASVQD